MGIWFKVVFREFSDCWVISVVSGSLSTFLKKLKTLAHKEFSGKEFSYEEIIKYKIEKKIDLFERGNN